MAVQIILKNSSIEDKKPSASQLTNGEISLNYNENGAFLCCKDTDGNLQQVGGVKIDEDAPDAPVKQTQWFKPSTLTLSVFDGDKWLPIAGGGSGGGGGGGAINQIIGNDGIDADTVAGIVTLDIELAGGDDGLEFKSSKLSATLASATDLGSVKVGDNIDVTAGKISVAKADASTFGVVKVGDGLGIAGDGTLFADVPTTTTYRGSCDLSADPTGQLSPEPPEKGDAYINSADASTVDAGWTGITGSAKIGDLVIFDGTQWDLIPLGAGTAPVTSVNTKTGNVVLDYTDVGAASEAQGDLADTALQPGDNITELNNDAGYITAAEAPVQSVNGKTGVVVLDAADVGALAPGDNVSLLANDAEYISKGDDVSDLANDAEYISKGDPVSDLDNDAEYLSKGDNVSDLDNDAGYITLADLPDIPEAQPPTIISDTAPTGDDAVAGNLWYNTNDGRIYIYYEDADSSQWVDASPDSQLEVVTSGPSFPLDPELNDLFFNTTEGRLYIYFDDGSSAQWVDAAPQGSADKGDGDTNEYWNRAGGTLFPVETNDSVNLGASKVQLSGVDGSINAAGKIKTETDANQFSDIGPTGWCRARRSADRLAILGGSDTYGLSIFDTADNVQIGWNGSSQFAGDMKIGITGSYTPSTPAISLNAADGSINAAGKINSGEFTAASTTTSGVRIQDNGQIAIQKDVTATGTERTFRNFIGDVETFAVQSSGSILIGGDLVSNTTPSPAISLNAADGTASFVEGGIQINTGSLYVAATTNSAGVFINRTVAADDTRPTFQINNLTETNLRVTAGGSLQIGTLAGTGEIELKKDGSSRFAGDMKIGTTGSFTPSTPAISLNAADGSGTFAGNVLSGSEPGNGANAGAKFGHTGFITVTRDGANQSVFSAYQLGIADKSIEFLADGSAEYKGYIQINNGPGYFKKTPAGGDGQSAFKATNEAGEDTFFVTNAGFSQFAGDMKIGTTGSFTPSTPAISLNAADGSITSAGLLKAGTIRPLNADSAAAPGLCVYNELDTGFFRPTNDTIGITTEGVERVRINSSGLLVGGALGTLPNITLRSADGSATFTGTVNGISAGTCFNAKVETDNTQSTFKGNDSANTVTFSVRGSGTAYFKGNVTAANVTFNLEADDDTKYTATTNEDGEQTLVYSGAVLDVKDRLQKADAALLALKKAAIAATDFASLKAAIVTALAGI